MRVGDWRGVGVRIRNADHDRDLTEGDEYGAACSQTEARHLFDAIAVYDVKVLLEAANAAAFVEHVSNLDYVAPHEPPIDDVEAR